MASISDILFAIEWLNANDSDDESEPLLRVADLLQGIITQRQRAMIRRRVVALLDAQDPETKHTRKGKAAIKSATDKAMEAIASQEQS